MKVQKHQLYPGVWYKAKIYNEDYIIQFEKFTNEDGINVANYYYKNKLHEGSCNWGYYRDVTELEIATEFPKEVESLIVSTYEIY